MAARRAKPPALTADDIETPTVTRARRRPVILADSEPEPVAGEGSEWAALEAQVAAERGSEIIIPANQIPQANRIPMGAFTLDFALMGGIPEGSATMVVGLESSGKTTITLKGVAGFQRKHRKRIAVWVDTESMFDKEWAETLGCDLSRLKVIQPSTGEEAVDLLIAAMGCIEVGLVVLDSIPGCVPQTVLDRSAEDPTMATLARLMGILCSKELMAWTVERRRGHIVTLIHINQWRSKVGIVYGSPNTNPGGRQINHVPTTKIELKNEEVLGKDAYDNEVVQLNDHTFKITKAKHGASIRNGQFQMIVNPDNVLGLAQGDFDDYRTVCTFAKKFGLLTGAGNKQKLPLFTEEVFAKLENIYQFLRENPKVYYDLRATIISMQRVIKGGTPLPPDGYLEWPGANAHTEEVAEMLAAVQES